MFLKTLRPALLTLALIPVAAQAELFVLTVNVIDAEPPTGTIEVSVFDSAETFLKRTAFQTPCRPAEDGTCSVDFAAVPDGEYAVVIVHDANDNKKLDNGFLGFGAESFAYSNDASNPLFGRASFDDAKFTLTESMENLAESPPLIPSSGRE